MRQQFLYYHKKPKEDFGTRIKLANFAFLRLLRDSLFFNFPQGLLSKKSNQNAKKMLIIFVRNSHIFHESILLISSYPIDLYVI